MAPLGVLTAIAGAIRVGGASWLKRLIGRARETNANTEMELMSSVSHEVCELWNGKSLVRTTGRPEIKQIIHFPAEEGDISPSSFHTMETANKHNALRERNKNAKLTGFKKAFEKSAASPQEHSPGDSAVDEVTQDNDSGNRDSKDDIESRTIRVTGHRTTLKNMPPNISLNIHGGRNPIELWLYAAFATILQTAVLVWSGFLAYSPYVRKHPQLTGIKPMVGFSLQATGTVLLTWSLVLCAGIIDKATLERHWAREGKSHIRTMSGLFDLIKVFFQTLANKQQSAADQNPREMPFRREDMQLYWVQKQHTAGDNSFDPYILYAGEVTDEIRESHRAEDKAWSDQDDDFLITQGSKSYKTTTFAVIIGIVGFLAQFQGLRFLNWTCSIAQLIALGIATILRAWVRRRMTKTPVAIPVNNDHILDNLTLAIVSKGRSGLRYPDPEAFRSPGLFLAFGFTTVPKLRAISNSESKDQEQPRSVHSTRAELEPVDPSSQTPIDAQLPSDNNKKPGLAQQALDLRVRLGHITEWTGAKSQEAIVLSNSIETAFERLSPQLPAIFGGKCAVVLRVDTYQNLPREPSTSMSDCQEEVQLHLIKEGDKWKVNDSQLEALLSLVSYSAWAAEQSKRIRVETDRGIRLVRLDSSGHSIEAQSLENGHSSGWLRAKAPDSKLCHNVVGKSSPKLLCDLFWWSPNMEESLNKAKYVGTCRESMVAVQGDFSHETDLDSEADLDNAIERHALGFYVSGESSKESGTVQNHLLMERALTCLDTFWSFECTEKQAHVLHIFSTFMWTTMKHIGTAAQFHPTTVTKPFLFHAERPRENGLLLPRLESDIFENLVQELESTGLGTIKEINRVLIPSLSHFDKLPNEAVADWHNKGLIEPEERAHWSFTHKGCVGLLEAIQFKDVQDRFAERAAAIVVGYLIRLVDEPMHQASGLSEEFIGNLRELINEAENKTVFKVFSSLGPLLSRQGNDFVSKILQLESEPSAPALETDNFTFPNNADVFVWTENYWAVFKYRLSLDRLNFHIFDLAGQSVLHHVIDSTVGLRDKAYQVKKLAFSISIVSSFENLESLTAQRNRQTPLHRVARAGHPMIIDALLKKGADPDAVDRFGRTSLCLAAYYGHSTAVNQLCDKMSLGSLNRTDVAGRNALYYAVLNHGGDVRFWKPKENTGSLQRKGNAAILENQENAALALIQHGIDCNARDWSHATPLWYAASGGMKRVIEVLRKMDLVDLVNLKRGRLINMNKRLTPEREAERAGHSEIATILKEWRLEKEQKLMGIRRYFEPIQGS